ncbi:prepilin-type N-terminal cleavage/methylation domain-containing protein [Halanaerobium sp. Z-7514]|uniref:Prepilin-type N-terminal cleavage/methylation domain-containing protein n=1 Tax=Halanaerobium polyolivorans TaxID=2886943 RepID=A0AAW4WRV7_9FIRM|nr:prepilin-type N-terminal cleavage/methylation domain-containing protein [Halanaerobium polyolivorans]MCC3143751.1 prepilin-type N-terminal cleavage/methylation domain-containing protein [Halanaerobium polyolivorans]RQD73855.1 MAG: prepilin-type N-terminal cleavage/methylation domain-containing protein [Halanaerobium sp. MSAO_Bac5]
MKNEAGFSLLEIIITISLAGIVLAVMSRTIKTGLEINSFLADKNDAVNWTESLLEAFRSKEFDLSDSEQKIEAEFLKQLQILESEELQKNYELHKIELSPYENNGVIYEGLYKLKIIVNYNCRDRERKHELITLLKE